MPIMLVWQSLEYPDSAKTTQGRPLVRLKSSNSQGIAGPLETSSTLPRVDRGRAFTTRGRSLGSAYYMSSLSVEMESE